MTLLTQIILYTAASGILSLAGGFILLGNTAWVKKFSIHFVSFAAGALLAISFLDLLPEAIEHGQEAGEIEVHTILLAAFAGFIAFFLLEKLITQFHYHHHEHDEQHQHATPALLMIGDGFHNFIDGVAIAATFLVDPSLGLITAIGVAAHELPQEIGDFSILLHHGWSKSATLWANILISLTSVVGAIVAYSLRNSIEPYLPHLLAITAGIFIYIASADLLPEITSRTKKDKSWHVILLVFLGIAAVWIVSSLFGGH
jgi:zinc and cadmium transporter